MLHGGRVSSPSPFQPTQPAEGGDDAAAEGGGATSTRTFGWPVSLTPKSPSKKEGRCGGCRGDALAEMPLVKPRAQLAFKDSMIRGILQFTLRIAFRCVLHRCKSQDIRC